jgi:soluble lytic murein transglycosylase
MGDNALMRNAIQRWCGAAAMVIVASASLCAIATAHAQSDSDFVAAKAAFERGDWRQLDALAPALSGHVLARYVEYWQLKSRLDDAVPEAVQSFVARYPDGPLSDRLRVDWLKVLGKRGDWNRFALDYPPATGEDTELACYGAQYRFQRDGAGALASARPLWFTGASTPDACEPVFAALIARGDLSVADRRARFRLAAAAGNARLAQAIGADLPPADRIATRDLLAVDRDPLKSLAKGQFAWKTAAGRELALYALERAARKDAGEARVAWQKWRTHFTTPDRNYGSVRVAYHAARQLNPQANLWFHELPHVALTPDEQAWRVRAALRAGAWHDVKAAIEALPAADQQEPVWRYWRGGAPARGKGGGGGGAGFMGRGGRARD